MFDYTSTPPKFERFMNITEYMENAPAELMHFSDLSALHFSGKELHFLISAFRIFPQQAYSAGIFFL